MIYKYHKIGKILFLVLCIQKSIGYSYAEDIVFNSQNSNGGSLPINTNPIGSVKETKNLINNTTINADGSITVSGSQKSESKPLGNTGLSLTKQNNPTISSFDNRNDNSNDEFVVRGGSSGAKQFQDMNTIKGSAAGVSATIGGGTNNNLDNTPNSQPPISESTDKKLDSKSDNSNKKDDVVNYTGGVGNSSDNQKNDSGRVLIFHGGKQNNGTYQVVDNNKGNEQDNNTPTLASFQSRDSNKIIDGSSNNPMPSNIQERINKSIQDLPLPKDLPPLPGSKNGNVMLPISLPTSKAVDLPPLPQEFIPNLGVQIGTTEDGGINNNGIAVNPNGEPINYNGISSDVSTTDDTGIDSDWTDIMQSEANAFMDMGLPLRIIVVNSENNVLRKFVSQSILRTTKETFEGTDIGLTSILSTQSTGDNINAPTCYIMFKNEDLLKFKKQFLDPLSEIAGKKATASYLIGHQVAHCMDNLERYKVIPKQSVWFANDISHYGIAAPVMRRIYPYGMTYNQYSHTTMHFYQDMGQRQYQERIADIFGLYLALYRGYDKKIVDAVQMLRKGLPFNSSHNTLPAINDIYNRYSSLVKNNVQDLWRGARELQYEVGIDSSLGDGAVLSYVYNTGTEDNQSNTNTNHHKKISSNKTKTKKVIVNDKVSFDEYSSFGDGKNGMGKPFGTSNVE